MTQKRRGVSAVRWALQALVFFGAWVAFTGKFVLTELLCGVAASAIAATASHLAWAESAAPFDARARWFLPLLRLPWDVARDTIRVTFLLLRQLSGGPRAQSLFVAIPFEAGGDDTKASARRALAISWVAVTPGTVPVGVDLTRDVLLVHALEPIAPPESLKPLGRAP